MTTETSSPRTVLAVMCTGYFLVLLDVTVVNVALPRMGEDLGTTVAGLQWVVDGYAIALASLMLGGGTFGDVHGHKRVVMIGFIAFGAASLVCGLAPGTGVLVAGRVVQGVGAALLLPGTLAIITRAYPGAGAQARVIGVWAGVGSVGLAAGPLLGGALVQAGGWRAVFLLNVPVVAAACWFTARTVNEEVEPSERRVDVRGIALGAVFLAALTFAAVEAGRAGFGAPVWIGGAAALLALVAFVAAERATPDPMLPLDLLRRPWFAAPNAVAAMMNLGTLGTLFVLTLYLQTVQGRSALQAGVATLPLFVPLSVLAPFVGRLAARVGPRRPMVAGLALSAAGMLLLTRLEADSSYATILPGLVLWGVGLAVLTPAVVAAAVSGLEPGRAGLGSAVNNTARQAGGAVGIAVFGAIAGAAGDRSEFLSGLHLDAVLAAAGFALAAVATLVWVPRHPGPVRGGSRRGEPLAGRS